MLGKVLMSKLQVSRVNGNSVEVDIWYRWVRIVAEAVGPTCPIFTNLAYCKFYLVGSRCLGKYLCPSCKSRE